MVMEVFRTKAEQISMQWMLILKTTFLTGIISKKIIEMNIPNNKPRLLLI